MAPVVDRVGDVGAGEAGLVKEGGIVGGREGDGALGRLGCVALAQRVGDQDPGAVGTVCGVAGEAEHGQVEQRARLDQVVEDSVVAEHAVGLDVDAAGVESAQGHTAGRARLASVDDAGDRLRVAGRFESAPAGVEQVGREKAAGQRMRSGAHLYLLSDRDGSWDG